MNNTRIDYFAVEKKSIIFFAATFLVVVVFVGLSIMAGRQAQEQNEKMFNDQQAMQAKAVVLDVKERVNTIAADANRIADARIPWLLQDKKLETLLIDIFMARMKIYPETLAYVYMCKAKCATVTHRAETQAGAKAESLCLKWSEQFWSKLSAAGSEPFVPPFHVTNTNQILGLLLPVQFQGEFSGVLAVAIDLGHLAEHYVAPMRFKKHGHTFLLDDQGSFVYFYDAKIVGRNLFDGMRDNRPEMQKLDKRVLNEFSGRAEYFYEEEQYGGPARKIMAWNAAQIGERRLIVGITATDTEISETLHFLSLQRMILTGFLILLAVIVIFFLARARHSAQKSEKKFRRHVENLGKEYFFYSHDRDGFFTYVSPSVTAMLGYEQQEFKVKYENLLTDNPINNVAAQKTKEGFDGKKYPAYEIEVFNNTGSRHQLEIAETPIFDSNGYVIGIEGIAHDITESKRAEIALLESEQRYRRLADHAQDVIFRISIPDGGHEYVSPSCTVICGYTPEEFYANPLLIRTLVHPQWEDYFDNIWQKLLQGDMPPTYEYQIIDKSGQEHWIFQINVLIQDEAGKPVALEGIVRDITDRKDDQLKIEQERNKAQLASNAKSDFLANMSHEIRTPLNGVLGMLQLMQTTNLDVEQKQFVLAAIRSSKRLNIVLSDILDLSRVEAGKLIIQNKPFSIAKTLAHVHELFQIAAKQAGVELSCYVDSAIPHPVIGDSSRLQQILNNIVGNALKFTNSGNVIIEAYPLPVQRPDQCRVLFTVSDSGIGIPDNKLDTLFESFTQVSDGSMKKHQGVGLGLAICKHLIDLMDGNMAVSSELGVGTTFYFCVPFGLDESIAVQAQAADKPEEISLESLKILLADDENINRIVSQKLLEKAGCKVTAVEDGQQVLDALRQDSFDVVLMDVQMPVMNGVEATKAIRRSEAGEHNKQIPIIALTAHVMAGDKEKFLEAGMDDYASKPVEVKTLRTILSKVIREAREG